MFIDMYICIHMDIHVYMYLYPPMLMHVCIYNCIHVPRVCLFAYDAATCSIKCEYTQAWVRTWFLKHIGYVDDVVDVVCVVFEIVCLSAHTLILTCIHVCACVGMCLF